MHSSLERILGYLVLALVDEKDARDLSSWLSCDLDDLYFELHVSTEVGVEIFICHQQERPAKLEFDKDKKKVSGRTLIYVEPSMVPWTDEGKTAELYRLIWNEINDDSIQTHLTEDQLQELENDLIALREIEAEDSNFCLAVPYDNQQGAIYREAAKIFLQRFKIPVVHFKVQGDRKAFHGIEGNLMSAIKQLLIKLNQVVDEA